MRTTGLLGEVLPELLEGVGVTQNRFHKFDVYGHTLAVVDNTHGEREGWRLRLGALLHDVGKPRARQPREGAPGEFSFFKHEYVGADMADAIGAPPEAVGRRSRAHRRDGGEPHVLLFARLDRRHRAPVRAPGRQRRRCPRCSRCARATSPGAASARIPTSSSASCAAASPRWRPSDAALRITDLAIDGKDVMRILGIAPGRIVGVVLERLLERVLDDPSLNEPDRLAALVPEVARD